MVASALAVAGAVVAMSGLCGCASDPHDGYAFDADYPTDIQTVRVPIFDNHTFAHGVEAQLTEAIAKELLRATPYRVTTSAEADTVLSGVITNVEMRTLSRDSTTGYVQELAVRVTIDFDWRDTRNGHLLVSRRGFSGVDTFVPTARTRETVEYGQTVTVQRLANDVVRTLRSGW
jgi:hypothetical protein